MGSFSSLGVPAAIIKGLQDLKISQPTEIQEKAIPLLSKGDADFVGLAKTGTGKTAAFCLPLLMRTKASDKHIQSIILVPTRELGQQIFANLEAFGKYLPDFVPILVAGGSPLKPQMSAVANGGQIVIATPGRLIDLIKRNVIDLSKTNTLVMDEADEMVTSLKEGLGEIVPNLPKVRNTWLFSATMPVSVQQIIKKYMQPEVVRVSIEPDIVVNQGITHEYVIVEAAEKLDVLMHFLNQREGERGIIFCNTKAAVNKLAKNLAINRFSSGALHGSFSQAVRNKIMEQFRNGHIRLLVATDVAARGIDLHDISFVVHYHLPDVKEVYVHRSGRTARAGASGHSLVVIQADELPKLKEMERDLGIQITSFKKPGKSSLEENNIYLWFKQIFKTKPHHQLDAGIRNGIKEALNNLSKEELIDKLIAHYLLQNRSPQIKSSTAKKINRNKQ